MADIRFPSFGSRRRRAGGNASAFWKHEQPDEVLQKNEKRRAANAPDEYGSLVLRDELLGHVAYSIEFDV